MSGVLLLAGGGSLLLAGGGSLLLSGDGAPVAPVFATFEPAPLSPRWTIELCGVSFDRLHEVQAGDFSGVMRRNAAGQWRCRVAGSELDPSLAAAVQTVKVVNGSSVVMAGYVSPLGGAGGGRSLVRSAGTDEWVFEGVDLWRPLQAMLAWPEPPDDADPLPPVLDTFAVATDDRGPLTAGELAAAYIDANVGPAASRWRRSTWDVTVSAAAVGSTLSWSARFDPLDRLVGAICDAGGVVCVPSLAGAGPLYRFRAVQDRSASVIFSDVDDLAESVVSVVPPRSTVVIVGGAGEGAARAFTRSIPSPFGGPGDTWIEAFSDQSNAQGVEQMEAIAEVVRAEDAEAITIDGVITEAAAQRFPFDTAWRLGDLVGVQVNGERYAVPVTAVAIEVNAERSIARPVLGQWTNDRLQGLRRDVLGLADRFDRTVR